jgi:ferric-dicitrate binding protein FerR (iron transport regulator)
MAAASIVVLALSWFAFRQISPVSRTSVASTREVNEISTRPGSKTRVELPDGSIVWLNAGSKLTYNKDFNQQLREVSLTGEGYFDVAKNKEKPFIIHTSTINVKVLGTVFNVKAYPQDKRTETSLIRGSVEVTIRSRPNDKIILSPSEKLIVENGNARREKQKSGIAKPIDISPNIISLNRISVNPVDSTIAETAWVNNRMVFRDEAFEDLVVQMQRWYNINLEIKDESLKNKRLSGTFESETVTQALDALKFSISFKYDQEGNNIFIHR